MPEANITTAYRSLIAAAVALLAPGLLSAQLLPRVEVRAGFADHGGGGCDRLHGHGPTAGFTIGTRGRWVAYSSVDLFTDTGPACLDVGPPTLLYNGQTVEIWDRPSLGLSTPRLSLALGYGLEMRNLTLELTGGLGTVRTNTDHGPWGEDISWRRWYGGAVTVRLGRGPGVQFELGRHQLTERYYLQGQNVVVAEFFRRETMWRVVVSVPVIR